MSLIDEVNHIREVDEDDFEALLCACSVYAVNKNSEYPIEVVGKTALQTILYILDKHNVDYINDL